MMDKRMESERLLLREMGEADYEALYADEENSVTQVYGLKRTI